MSALTAVKNLIKREPLDEVIADRVASHSIKFMVKPIKSRVTKAHHVVRRSHHHVRRYNGIGGRGWIYAPGQYQMVIVYHDANRVGPHIDVHIGRMSMVYRVKPDLYAQLKTNNDGMLTENSRKLIMEHLRSEIGKGAQVPQNLDHSMSNARASWTKGDPNAKYYGAGTTRQVVHESTVDVYKTGEGHPVEFYAPAINPHRGMYIYNLYSGDSKRAPILIWGNRAHNPRSFDDRLHLKLVQPADFDVEDEKFDKSTSTAKYDGSSCYFVITPKGTTVWSPRTSKKTGQQIEYTYMLDGLAGVTSGQTIVGMGELMFKTKSRIPWRKNEYLPQAAGSGILNSHDVLPDGVDAEIRVYRVDRVGRNKTTNLDFWENRDLQEQVSRLSHHFQPVELMDPEEAQKKGFEGVVVAPPEGSVNDAFKVKWWTDLHDWEIINVDLFHGSKGGHAGVVRARSLESDKEFNLGPGQLGDQKLTGAMMENPDGFVGSVLKVQSRHGFEGRASKVVGFHDDKGFNAEYYPEYHKNQAVLKLERN